jgi:hypothetical protein
MDNMMYNQGKAIWEDNKKHYGTDIAREICHKMIDLNKKTIDFNVISIMAGLKAAMEVAAV